MKLNKWTIALAATGVVSAASALADESYPVTSLVSGSVLSGYVDTAAIWNLGTGRQVANRFANTASDRQDGFNLNFVKLQLEKALDEGTWSAGYKFETMFGPDAAVMPGRLGSSDIAIKQAYVALRAPVGNGIDFKIGQFDPIIGYEVTDSYANPNFARSFGFNVLEPFGHQGVLASYQLNDTVGLSAGVANSQFGTSSGVSGGINIKDPVESVKSYMAGIVIKAPEDAGWLAGSSLYAGVVKGGLSGASDPINYYVGGTMATPIEALTLGASFDYLANGSFESSYGNASALYASFQVTEKFKLNGRAEYATSSGGIFQPGNVNDESIFGYTLTADYMLWANVVTRAEFRWDRNLNGVGVFDGKKNDLSLALNIIYKF
jgi:hypothetical protein